MYAYLEATYSLQMQDITKHVETSLKTTCIGYGPLPVTVESEG